MTQDQSSSIFGQEQQATPTEQPSTPSPAFQLPPEVTEFVGQGKKYATPEDALKSVPHAQQFIEQLKQELNSVKEELANRKSAAELLEEMRNQSMQPGEKPSPVEFDPSAVEKMVEQVVQRKEQVKSAQHNVDVVRDSFTAKWGEQAESVYIKIAEESGLSIAQINQLAATSPKTVLKLAGIDQAKKADPLPGKTSSSLNTEALGKTSQDTPSAKVKPIGASTRDLLQAWKNAGAKVQQSN